MEQIAKKHCHVETRRSDSLDFHDISVWDLKAALEEDFAAGAAHQLAFVTDQPAVQKETSAPTPGKPSLLAGLRDTKVKSEQQKGTPSTTKSEPEL